MKLSLLTVLVSSSLLALVAGEWGHKDYEIFRLRDELALYEGPNVTFYDFLGIKPSASQDDINRGYKKRSKVLHPDKAEALFLAARAMETSKPKPGDKPGVHVNKKPTAREIQKAVKLASERFTRLGLIKTILRGEGRERYDHFLHNGFPAWRGTGYYYARFRPGLGSTLLGLFVFGAGLTHYVILVLNWRSQKQFVERYIRQARKAAWGDDSASLNIPGVDTSASAETSGQEEGATLMNRKQKRQQDKESKKGKENKKDHNRMKPALRSNATDTPIDSDATGPQGHKKRVQAENGKVLLVDSIGNVFLEGENDEGKKEQLLLDPSALLKPTFKETILFKLPIWIYTATKNRLVGGAAEEELVEEGEVWSTDSDKEAKAKTRNGSANGQRKRKNKTR